MGKVIEIKNFEFAYPDGTRALEGVDLDIWEKESIGIIGPNGAGKSTLLLHLNGLLSGKGDIRVFDKPVSKETIPLLRRKIGFVFQDPQDQLFMPTVFEDVAFGPIHMGLNSNQVDKQAEYALEQVGLIDKKECLSHHLSFGQQKRVSIATVLSMDPEMLVLDEPSSNLDHVSRRHLINFLKNVHITKIIATHDLEMVLELCQKVVFLDRGKIVACGETKEVLFDSNLLKSHGLEVPLSLLLSKEKEKNRCS